MQPQVVRQLSSATPGKIIVVKEQEPRPIRSGSAHHVMDRRAAPPSTAHSGPSRKKSSSSKQAHTKNTPKQIGKKKLRSGTPKKQRIPEPPQLQPPVRYKDTSLKDTLVSALLARMRAEGPLFGASISRSVTPSGIVPPPQQSIFATTSMEDELIRKLKQAVVDTLHEEGISRHEDSPKVLRNSLTSTRNFGTETDTDRERNDSRVVKDGRKRKKTDPAPAQVTKTSVQLPNKLNTMQQRARTEPSTQPVYDDLQDNELYEKELNELMNSTYIPGTTVDEYTANPSSADDVIDLTAPLKPDAHVPALYDRVNMNWPSYEGRQAKHANTVVGRQAVEPPNENYDGSDSEQSVVTKELHNAVEMITKLAPLVPNNTKEDKNISQMVTNLSTAINTIYHAYKEDKNAPTTSSPDTHKIANSKKSPSIERPLYQHSPHAIARNEVSDTQDHVPSYKDTVGIKKALDDAIFEYPEIPEKVMTKMIQRIASQVDRDPNITEEMAKQLFKEEIDSFLIKAAAEKGDKVELALTYSNIASSKVGMISTESGQKAALPGLADEDSAPSMTLPEQTDPHYAPYNTGVYPTRYQRSHLASVKTHPVTAGAEQTTTMESNRSSSATDLTQMSLSDYTNIPVPKIEKIKPNSSYASETSVDYVIQRTNFDKELPYEGAAPHNVPNPFTYAQNTRQLSPDRLKYSPQDEYLERASSDFKNLQHADLQPIKVVPTVTNPTYLPQQHVKASPPPVDNANDYEFNELGEELDSTTQGIDAAVIPLIPDNYKFDDLDPSQLQNRPVVEIEHELNLADTLQADEPTDGYERYMHQKERISRQNFFDGAADLPVAIEVGQPDHDTLVKRVMDDDSKDWDTQINEQLDFVDEESDSEPVDTQRDVSIEPLPTVTTTINTVNTTVLPQELISAGKSFGIDESILNLQPPAASSNFGFDQQEVSTVPVALDGSPESLLSCPKTTDTISSKSHDYLVDHQENTQRTALPDERDDTHEPNLASVTQSDSSTSQIMQHPEELELEPEPRQPILYEPDPNVTSKEVEQYVDVFCTFIENATDTSVSLEALIDVDNKTTYLSALFDCCIIALSNVGLCVVSQLSKAVITDCDALEADYLDNNGFYKFTLDPIDHLVDVFLIKDRFRAALAEGYAKDMTRLRGYLVQQLKSAASVQPSYTAAVTAGVKQTEQIFFDEMDAVQLSREIADRVLDDVASEVAALFSL